MRFLTWKLIEVLTRETWRGSHPRISRF